ncbi:hypothetical protein ACFPFV_09330 [Salinicoccus siamensis]|uniref:Type VII secretion system (Wss) protein ESAT-6 n=1 Tax=Salinicoccus siamensis TaxID=381830 RepID=A0ABV5Z4K2_9STAP
MPTEDKDIAIKIFDRLGQIDGKVSGLEQIRQRADDAFDKSNKAFDMSEHNEKKLKELSDMGAAHSHQVKAFIAMVKAMQSLTLRTN